jgi:hypothetical protein
MVEYIMFGHFVNTGTYAGTPTVINWVDPDTPGRGDTRIRTKLAWGAQISRKKQDFRIVDFQLPPHSRLQITLDGSVQARRRPYSARLSSFYPSNTQKTRKIRGHFLDEDLLAVEVIFFSPTNDEFPRYMKKTSVCTLRKKT